MLGGSSCHHGMARPRVADGRDGLKLEVTPWPLVRERTIPTDRPPLVDEI
jgi:hypothetical protein